MRREQTDSRQSLLAARLQRGEKLEVDELLELMDALLARREPDSD